MKTTIAKITSPALAIALLMAGGVKASAQSSELDQLKAAMETMQKTMGEMQNKIKELEAASRTNAPAAATEVHVESVKIEQQGEGGTYVGHVSRVVMRPALKDDQESAQRPDDLTLDPKYHGFIPIPHTPGLIKFNAKPRVDIISDTRNSGNPDRFVTATIPVEGQADFGGSEQFNINSRGSSLSVDVRAPEVPGNFRFYYNNDFFGGGTSGGMTLRVKHLYGQFYNVTAGFTYSCFEDPDAWPDTVDFEGPNSVIFARRPLVRYMVPIAEAWQMNFGVEAPGSEVDANSVGVPITQENRAPDVTMNGRWENEKRGHIQLGGVVRDIGARSSVTGSEHVIGWGLNLASSINVFKRDSFQTQLTYGEGIFRYMNDDFINNDAAFDAAGDLEAIPCLGAMAGYTHRWTDDFRSTATYGYVNLDNVSTQGTDAYDETHYASVNLVYQLRKRLSVGLEGLYGKKETQSGATGDVWRFQVGLVYSLFD